uniref:Uncharacterized protein n=1 Tax=Zooxanthella nutricula TaxID=1333877 RepID=A0A7S2HUY5_9DINO
MAAAMHVAAERMEKLESVIQEFGQALQMVNLISGSTLRDAVGGRGGVEQSPDAHPASRESTRSFLLKKGDAETQELHKAASALRPSGNCGGTGSLSSSAKPLTKEEMDKARNARLAKLEEQQAQKQKEMEDAEERGKARDSLFNRPLTGPAKQLGRL